MRSRDQKPLPSGWGAVTVNIKRLPNGHGLPVPTRATRDAAGMDIVSAEMGEIGPGQWRPFRTGFAIELPRGYEAQIRPRSGLAMRHGLTVLNAPGTIDADYRGEIAVILINHSLVDSVWVNRGDRIAQLVIAPVCSIEFDLVESISVTARGEGGFGSTG